ncbi:hypothetical protein Hore_17150 [Halothermothrix orenii H 168]|uniref:FlgN family protein n=1 Tax=Halothermothrix orenii (strain H 168 / OCM 544 / DSM 9562) TaxID=373903 RepID=B8CYU5_HALOH|nr:hypothetical protein Hore_17150 [Halothermothrix orenii H 168]
MLYENFLNLFKKEYELYCQLQDMAERKQEAIVDNNVEKLTEIMHNEQELIDKISDMEEKRRELLAEIAHKQGFEGDKISFQQLFTLFPEEDKAELKELKEDFLEVLSDLQTTNESNRQLIEDSLKINNFTLQLIRQAAGKNVTYKKPGKKDEGSDHIIDRRA